MRAGNAEPRRQQRRHSRHRRPRPQPSLAACRVASSEHSDRGQSQPPDAFITALPGPLGRVVERRLGVGALFVTPSRCGLKRASRNSTVSRSGGRGADSARSRLPGSAVPPACPQPAAGIRRRQGFLHGRVAADDGRAGAGGWLPGPKSPPPRPPPAEKVSRSARAARRARPPPVTQPQSPPPPARPPPARPARSPHRAGRRRSAWPGRSRVAPVSRGTTGLTGSSGVPARWPRRPRSASHDGRDGESDQGQAGQQ